MSQVTVHKLDEEGEQLWSYPGEVVQRRPHRLVLTARYDRAPVTLAGLSLLPGDRFLETFYIDRWYNVFRVQSADGSVFRGWYCNLARPARLEESDVYQEDLALDLIVLPGGSYAILDREEFEALKLGQAEQEQVLRALNRLIKRANQRASPFELPKRDGD